MEPQSVQELSLDEMLLNTVKDKTVELPITEHLVLRITPHDWASGEIVLFESLCITEAGKNLLQKALTMALK